MLEERAHAQIVKNPARKLSAKNACVAPFYSCNRCKKLFSSIAHSACQDNAAIWLLHHSEPSDY